METFDFGRAFQSPKSWVPVEIASEHRPIPSHWFLPYCVHFGERIDDVEHVEDNEDNGDFLCVG